MKNWSFLSILALFFSLCVFGQEKLSLNAFDAHTRKGIPYATVKVLNKPEGAYANENGMFLIKATRSDSIMVSCVGYKPARLLIDNVDTIFLQPVFIALDEVKVNAKKRKEKSFGYYNTKKSTTFLGGRIHSEFATKLLIPKDYVSYRIKKIKINTRNRNETNPVRLHIYSLGKDGLPDKELLTEDIIINDWIKANDEIDLARLELVLSERILFVGIEWIEGVVDRKIGYFTSIGFGYTSQIPEKLTYSRTLRDPKYQWRDDLWGSNYQNLMVSLVID